MPIGIKMGRHLTAMGVARQRELFGRSSTLALLAGLAIANGLTGQASALPVFDSSPTGNISGNETATSLTVFQGDEKGVANWTSFDIAPGETVTFEQPSATSITLNRVVGDSGGILPTLIEGVLNANGNVWLLNPSGVVMSSTASIDAAGFLATTSRIDDADFLAPPNSDGESVYPFFTGEGDSPAAVINEGSITVNVDGGTPTGTKTDNGYVLLSAPGVVNSGTIAGRLSTVALGGTNAFTVTFEGNELVSFVLTEFVADKLSGYDALVEVSATGQITVEGGGIVVGTAAFDSVVDNVVNMDGIIEADAAVVGGETVNGFIELVAFEADTDSLVPTQTIAISGTATSSGGTFIAAPNVTNTGTIATNGLVTIEAENTVDNALGGEITALQEGSEVAISGELVFNEGDIAASEAVEVTASAFLNFAEGSVRATGPNGEVLIEAGLFDNDGLVATEDAANPGEIFVGVDAFTNTGAITSPGGTVYLRPSTPGRAVDLVADEVASVYAPSSDVLTITEESVQGITAEVLVIGATPIGPFQSGSSQLIETGTLTVYGSFEPQTVVGGVTVGTGTLVLSSTEDIVQGFLPLNPGSPSPEDLGALIVPQLSLVAGGAIDFASRANSIGELAASSGVRIEVANGIDLTVTELAGVEGFGSVLSGLDAPYVRLSAPSIAVDAPITAPFAVILDALGPLTIDDIIASSAIFLGAAAAPSVITIGPEGGLESLSVPGPTDDNEPLTSRPIIYVRADEETGDILMDPASRITVLDDTLLSAFGGGDVTLYASGLPPAGSGSIPGLLELAIESVNGSVFFVLDGAEGGPAFDIRVVDSSDLVEFPFETTGSVASGLVAGAEITLFNDTVGGSLFLDGPVFAGGDIILALASVTDPLATEVGQFVQAVLVSEDPNPIESANGDITIIADQMQLGYISSAGTVSLETATAGRNIFLVSDLIASGQLGPLPGAGLTLAQAEINRITAETLTIGRTTDDPTGDISVFGSVTFGLGDGVFVPPGSIGLVSLLAGGSIGANTAFGASLLTASDLDLLALGDIDFGPAYQLDADTLTASAGGGIFVRDVGDLVLGDVTAESGDVEIDAEDSLTISGAITSTAGSVFLGANYAYFTSEGTDPAASLTMLSGSSVSAALAAELYLYGENSVPTGNLTAGAVSGSTVLIEATGAGGDVALFGPISATAPGTSLIVASALGDVFNSGGTLDPGAGRFLVFSQSPAASDLTGLSANPFYGTTYPTEGDLAAAGNRFVFAFQPTLTVTPLSATRVYGDENPDLPFTVEGLVGNDDLGAALSGEVVLITEATIESDVGTYAINVDLEALSSDFNYLIAGPSPNAAGPVLTITPAPITVTADNTSKIYGDAVPVLTFTVDGLKLDDTVDELSNINLSTNATIASDVGTYAITVSEVSSSGNYFVAETVDGLLEVTPASLTVTADDATRIYGDADPAIGFSVSGLKLEDSIESLSGIVVTTTSNAASNVGAFETVASGGPGNGNYVIGTFINGTYTITPAAIVLLADDASRVYGDANPAFTFTADGLKLDDTVASLTGITLVSDAAPASNVGLYDIDFGGTLTNPNYVVSGFEGGTLTVTPAPLTVTADDAERFVNAANPPFTATITGLKLGDTADVISGLVLSTDALADSPPGAYTIFSEGGEATNYIISVRIDGTLTIEQGIVPGIVDVAPTLPGPVPGPQIGEVTLGRAVEPSDLDLPNFVDPSRNGLLFDTELSTGGNDELW